MWTCPLEPADLAPAQACGQFCVEEVTPDFILCDDLHEHIQLLIRQYLLCPIAEPGSGDLLGRVAGDQVSLLCRLQRTVERGVDAAHRNYVYAPTQKELSAKLRQHIDSYQGADLTEQSRMMLSEWLDQWLRSTADTLRPNTLRNYRSYIENHIRPGLGDKARPSVSALLHS